MNRWHLLILTFGLCLGTFMQVLDSAITNVAVPSIAGDLGVSAQDGTWVITFFLASNAIVLPLTGWLAGYFGATRLFLYCVIAFIFSSSACGLSTSLEALIFFRAIQGAVSGPLMPLSQSLLLSNYPANKQGQALAIWGTIVIVAPVLGPIAGGYITDNYGWEWIFYINVPIGILSFFLTYVTLGWKKEEAHPQKMDYTALLALIFGVGALQILLDRGNDDDWFGSNTIIILTLISSISLIFFLIWNGFSDHPIVNFSFFKQRSFLFGTISMAMGYMFLFGSVVIQPLWLQTQMGYTPTWAGIAIAPIGIMPILLSPLLPRLMRKVDLRILISIGLLFFSLAMWHFFHFTTQISVETVMWTRLLQGLGVPFFFVPLISLALSEQKKEQLASASGIFNFFRYLVGGGFGTSIFVTLWSRREIFHHARLIDALTLHDFQEVAHEVPHYGVPVLEKMLSHQAYMMATDDVFLVTFIGVLCCIPLVWLCKVPQKEATVEIMGE